MVKVSSDKNGQKRSQRDERGRFVAGNRGGPGRPRGMTLTEIVRKELETVPKGKCQSRAEAFVQKLLKQADGGDRATQKLVWNYVDGLPKASVDMGVDKEGIAELTEYFRSMGQKRPERQR